MISCGCDKLGKIKCNYEASIKLKEKILFEFERRFGHAEKSFLLAESTILDPRFKKIHFTDPLALSSVLRKLRSEINAEESTGNFSETSTSSVSDTEDFDLWAHHKTLVHKKRRKNTDYDADVATTPQDELTFYLTSSVVGLKQNPIHVWKEMKGIYPKLYNLAKKYCYLIGTSVPSERLFSKAGAMATEKRNRLTTKR